MQQTATLIDAILQWTPAYGASLPPYDIALPPAPPPAEKKVRRVSPDAPKLRAKVKALEARAETLQARVETLQAELVQERSGRKTEVSDLRSARQSDKRQAEKANLRSQAFQSDLYNLRKHHVTVSVGVYWDRQREMLYAISNEISLGEGRTLDALRQSILGGFAEIPKMLGLREDAETKTFIAIHPEHPRRQAWPDAPSEGLKS